VEAESQLFCGVHALQYQYQQVCNAKCYKKMFQDGMYRQATPFSTVRCRRRHAMAPVQAPESEM